MTTVPEVPLTHTERARLVLEHIRGIKELIGGFTFAGVPNSRTLNFSKSIPDEFLESTAIAIEASEDLARTERVHPADLRDVVGFTMAFTPVANELGIMHRAVLHTIAIKRATVGELALQVYQMAKTMTRKSAAPVRRILIPHLESMQRALGRMRPKAQPAEPDPTAPPTSQPPTTEPAKKGGASA